MHIVFNHSHRVKPIGRVISTKRVNDELIIIIRKRKGDKNMIDILKALFWLIVAYLILAVLFNWWPINTLNWPF